MAKKIQTIKPRVFIFLFIILGMLVALSQSSFAIDSKPVTMTLPLEQSIVVNRDMAKENTFQYKMRALDINYPLPIGSENGEYYFSLEGNEAKEIGPITYIKAGEYYYQIEQVVTNKVEGYIYDVEQYTVAVYVKNQIDNTLSIEAIVTKSNGEKVANLNFTNTCIHEIESKGTKSSKVTTNDPQVLALWLLIFIISVGGVLRLTKKNNLKDS